jgi:hypothetical protein
MSWTEQEKEGFNQSCKQNIGQINLNSRQGQYIKFLTENPNVSTILEIGTWNGLGSTKCFIEGLKNKKNFSFYSLEACTDKHLFAKELYSSIPNVYILNEVIFNEVPYDICNVFPELQSDPNLKEWFTIDYNNIKDKPIFNYHDKIFDFVLLDGGEFTTYYEFLILQNRIKILMLDDTKCLKSKKICEMIKNSSNWNVIEENNERNGFLVAINKYV